ncbi:MAG: hypothetical protein D6702_12365 [Planctomycetota bacterium]|nr:MAG: hypothetical protein D6702_12365 [Planctomycetota bacterium]
MTGPNRGAAQVSVMWVIALCVILVFVALFGFTSQQKVTEWQEAAAQAQSHETDARTAQAEAQKAHADLSAKIGFIAGSEGFTSLDALSTEMAAAASVFGVPEAPNIESLLSSAVTAYQKALVEKRDLEAKVAQLRNDLDARRSAHQKALAEKDARIAELTRNLEDTTNSLNQRNLELERQRDSLRQQVADLDAQLAENNTRLAELQRQFEAEREVQMQANAILASKLNKVERRAETADGSVLAASTGLGKAWIDRGRLDRIVPGMEFDVRGAADKQIKGRLKVVAVEDERAECEILETANRFDPIGEDDLIFNAVYDPTRQPVAVLLGNGFGTLSATDMANRLAEVGILVTREISNEVDYLILGTPFFDEDTGEVIPWSSREEYRKAQESALTIVPLRDAMAWLGL